MAALLVGVPVLLVLLVGNPLPTTAPSKDWLTVEVNAGLMINVLAVLVWIVWAHFVVCFLTEWRALRAGRMPDRVLMGGGSQVLARQLIAGLLLLSGGAALAQGMSAAGAGAERASPSHSAAVQSADGTAQTGSASVNASTGQVQATADQQHGARQLKLATVKVPEGRHHDTLWGIAERTLGDPLRWKEILELNQGRVQPDGSKLIDADLIRPGWQMVLPADAHGPDVRLLGGTLPPVAPAPGVGAQGGAEAGSGSTAVDAMAEQVLQRADGGATQTGNNLGTLLLGGGLVLAGVVTALTARRGPYGAPDETEGELRLAANSTRSDLLDRALRVLSETRAGQGLPMPDLSVVYVNDEQVIAHVAGAAQAPAAPWTEADGGGSWMVRAADLEGYTATGPAPYPALVNIAMSHGFDALVDLEYASGLVAVGGHAATAREVVMSSVVDLVTHAWSDKVSVSLVGFGDDLGELAPDQITASADLDQALDAIEERLGATSSLLARLGVDGVLSGRGHSRNAELRPNVLVVSGAPSPAQVQRIRALSAHGRTAFAAVCVGDAPGARWRFAVEESGHIDLGVLGISGTARRLTLDAQQQLRGLLDQLRGDAASRSRFVAGAGPSQVLRETQGLGGRPVADAASPVAVRLLGPVAVEAPGPVDDARVSVLTELVTMAALHPQGLHETVLTSALWPRGVGADVVARTVRDAQTWLGQDSHGVPRLTRDDAGLFRLSAEVYVDWDHLQECAGSEETDIAALVRGLSLGRGEAFSATPAGQYSWLVFHRVARDARALITVMASKAAAHLAGQRDPAGAERALREGLRLVPAAEPLWRDLIRLRSGSDPGADAVVEEMYRTLPGHRVEPETEALAANLAPRVRSQGQVSS